MKLLQTMLTLIALAIAAPVLAQAPAEDPAHGELRKLRDGALDALNRGDIDALVGFLHPNAVVTWQNAEVSRGRDAVRAYYTRMMSGPDKKVVSFSTKLTVDELTILYGGDTGIAFGSSEDHFKLTSGQDFVLHSRWTATVVKEGDHWLLAAVHMSANLFDNPLLHFAEAMGYWMAGGGVLLGLLVGFFLARRKNAAA